MDARFNLRQTKEENKETQIYLVCSINSKQEKFSTGQKIRPKYWDKEKQVAIVSNILSRSIRLQNTKTNKGLTTILAKFEEWEDYMMDHPEEQERAADKLRTFLKDERGRLDILPLEWFETTIKENSSTSDGTKKKYLADLKTINQFIEEKKIRLTTFSHLNYTFITKYEAYLAEIGQAINTIINKQRSLLAWIHEAERQGFVNTIETGISRYQLPRNKETGNPIYLTNEEIEKLKNLSLEGNEQKILDIFLLQCQLGQRYSDMMNLDKAIISEKRITLIQEKTGKKVSIPLNDISKTILAKYNNKLPNIRLEYANELLKEIGKKAGINEEIIKTEQKGGKLESKKVFKYELIGTHTARRTFVSISLINGISPYLVMKITGHSSFKTMENYNKMTPDDVVKAFLRDIDLDEEKFNAKVKEQVETQVKEYQDKIDTQVEDEVRTRVKTHIHKEQSNSQEKLVVSMLEENVSAESIAEILEKSFEGINISVSHGIGMNIQQRKKRKK